MNETQWICKYNRQIDCGTSIPNCLKCGWNPFNVSLKCYRILKVLGVNRYADTLIDSSNIKPSLVDMCIQGREQR